MMNDGRTLNGDGAASKESHPRGDGEETALAFDIDEQPPSAPGARAPFAPIDLEVTVFPRPETRHLPIAERLRLLWHRQIPRGVRR